MSENLAATPALKCSLGVWALTAYGVGDILGAGIYALVGQVAGKSGGQIWIAFVVAMFTAALTGLTYAELVTRYPHSGGVATFCLKAFGRPRLAFFAGWLVLCSGVVSMSTVTRAFTNYVVIFFPEVPHWALWIAFLSAVAALNFWGLQQSSATNIVFTLIEAGGLVLVMTVGIWFLIQNGPQPIAPAPDAADQAPLYGILSGAALAFFAFIGFEDMVNIAEEVEAPERIYPRALLAAIAICGAIYITVSLIAVNVVPLDNLTTAERPLLEVVVRAAPAVPPALFTVIALVAVSNTGLLNAIMASRLIYGMSRHELLPAWLAAIHPLTHTPHRAVLLVFLAGIVLVFSGTLGNLAETTSLLLLVAFVLVNASSIRLRMTAPADAPPFRVPLIVPATAIVTCVTVACFVSTRAYVIVGSVALIGAVLSLLAPKSADQQTDDVRWE